MEKIAELCDFFYNVHHIPIYIYRNHEMIKSFPELPACCYPDSDFNDYIDNSDIFLYYITAENLFMGYIPLEKEQLKILLGPVNTIPYNKEQLVKLFFRKRIPKDQYDFCSELYQTVPCHSQLEFIDIILLLQYMITGNRITRNDFFLYQDKTNTDNPRHTFIQDHVDSEVNLSGLRSNDMLLEYIEQGDENAVFQYLCTEQVLPDTDFGNTPLVYRKHLCYYSIALFSEAAQRGGLDVSESLDIAASYYKDITNSSTVENVDFLTGRAALFYAKKVASVFLPPDITDNLLRCIQFIRQNVYSHIQVSDIASYIGYSRTHTTRLFKQKLGFTPSQLIMRTKLEEAKILLQYTDRSLSEISSALCFSSQSHFHHSFKAQFHMTPMEYRQKTVK